MILLYHKVDFQNEIHHSQISPKLFNQQMRWLFEQGYQLIPCYEYLSSNNKEKKIALTFDDGYENIAKIAFPILSQYNFRATVFVPTDYIGRSNSWDANLDGKIYQHLDHKSIQFLSQIGWEIGSHSTDHRSLLFCNIKNFEMKIAQSQKILSQITYQPIHGFSFPFGHFRFKELNILKKYYHYGVSVKTLFPGNYSLNRTTIYSFDTLSLFKMRIKKNIFILFFYYLFAMISTLFTFGTVIVQNFKKKIKMRNNKN